LGNLSTPKTVQKLQKALHAKAKAEAEYRFYALYDKKMQILLKSENELSAVRPNISKRLVVNLPPRSLKSFLVSVAWVAWCLGRNPSLQIVCASYAEELANKFSRDCRALMESPFYKRLFTQTRINPRKSTEAEFETTKRGSRLATSVGGILTGRGADILLVDDPTKAQ
jgi:hypothetical protein